MDEKGRCGACQVELEQRRDHNRRWYAKLRDDPERSEKRRKMLRRNYRENKPDRIEYHRQWRADNPDKKTGYYESHGREYSRKYYLANRETILAKQKKRRNMESHGKKFVRAYNREVQ